MTASWSDKIKLEVSEKFSLRCLIVQKYQIGKVHVIWKNAGFNIMAIKKAVIKARLMTGAYEPRHDKTNKMTVRPAKTQISLGIRPV